MMEEKSQQDPFSDNNLDSPEYRARLMRKLNCLVALLEVAISRVHQTLAGPDPDVDRLERIRENLQGTLGVCVRARVALEERQGLPSDLPQVLGRITFDARDDEDEDQEFAMTQLPPGAIVEFSTAREREKFERLGPISTAEVEDTDLEDLGRRLMGA
jgi:hypothetical protein